MENILQVRNLKKHFKIKDNFSNEENIIKAVNNISFNIDKGKTFGLVGESGSGKTTVGKCIIGLYKDIQGQVIYKGDDLVESYKTGMADREIQIVFQDSHSSLNPMMTIQEIIEEPILAKSSLSKKSRKAKIADLLNKVNLHKEMANRYPHELSGGQRQRVSIARAISTEPDLIVLDEPVSSLDMSIQVSIIKMLKRLQDEMGVSYLFISHDLQVVKYISHTIGVMLLGKIVEYGDSDTIFNEPVHPYTIRLMDSILYPDPKNKTLFTERVEKKSAQEIQKYINRDHKWEKIGQNHYILK